MRRSLVSRLLVFFFFSSRRRHTRLQGDWSSDVCSSDLTPTELLAAWRAGAPVVKLFPASAVGPGYIRDVLAPRSEEHTSELQSPCNLVCRLLLEKKKKKKCVLTTHRQGLMIDTQQSDSS